MFSRTLSPKFQIGLQLGHVALRGAFWRVDCVLYRTSVRQIALTLASLCTSSSCCACLMQPVCAPISALARWISLKSCDSKGINNQPTAYIRQAKKLFYWVFMSLDFLIRISVHWVRVGENAHSKIRFQKQRYLKILLNLRSTHRDCPQKFRMLHAPQDHNTVHPHHVKAKRAHFEHFNRRRLV
jgi:hypothetical protein